MIEGSIQLAGVALFLLAFWLVDCMNRRTDTMIGEFHILCAKVINGCKDPYAVAYAKAGLNLWDHKPISVQILYILNNMQHWRGLEAKHTRERLKALRKELENVNV